MIRRIRQIAICVKWLPKRTVDNTIFSADYVNVEETTLVGTFCIIMRISNATMPTGAQYPAQLFQLLLCYCAFSNKHERISAHMNPKGGHRPLCILCSLVPSRGRDEAGDDGEEEEEEDSEEETEEGKEEEKEDSTRLEESSSFFEEIVGIENNCWSQRKECCVLLSSLRQSVFTQVSGRSSNGWAVVPTASEERGIQVEEEEEEEEEN